MRLFRLLIYFVFFVMVTNGKKKKPNQNRSDFYFIFDNSDEMDERHFRHMLNTAVALVERLDVGHSDNRLGFGITAKRSSEHLPIDNNLDKTQLIHKIRSLNASVTSNRTFARVLDKARSRELGPHKDKNIVPRVLVLFISANHSQRNKERILKQALRAKSDGIVVYSLTFGRLVDQEFTTFIASDPKEKFSFAIPDPMEEGDIFNTIKENSSEPDIADIYFVLDNSDAMTDHLFQEMLDMAVAMAEGLNIGPNATRLGFGIVGTRPSDNLHIDNDLNKTELTDTLRSTNSSMTEKRRGLGLFVNRARSNELIPRPDREDIPRILVIFLAAKHSERVKERVRKKAKLAKSTGIYMYSLSFGNQVDNGFVQSMASNPKKDFAFKVQNGKLTSWVLEQIVSLKQVRTSGQVQMMKADVSIVLDNNCIYSEWYHQLDFVVQLVKDLDLRHRATRLSFSTISATHVNTSPLTYAKSKFNLINKILNTKCITSDSGSRLDLAIDAIKSGYVSRRKRLGVARIIVLISNFGNHRYKNQTKMAAASAKARGFHIYTVNYRQVSGSYFSKSLASSPSRNFSFVMDHPWGYVDVKQTLLRSFAKVSEWRGGIYLPQDEVVFEKRAPLRSGHILGHIPTMQNNFIPCHISDTRLKVTVLSGSVDLKMSAKLTSSKQIRLKFMTVRKVSNTMIIGLNLSCTDKKAVINYPELWEVRIVVQIVRNDVMRCHFGYYPNWLRNRLVYRVLENSQNGLMDRFMFLYKEKCRNFIRVDIKHSTYNQFIKDDDAHSNLYQILPFDREESKKVMKGEIHYVFSFNSSNKDYTVFWRNMKIVVYDVDDNPPLRKNARRSRVKVVQIDAKMDNVRSVVMKASDADGLEVSNKKAYRVTSNDTYDVIDLKTSFSRTDNNGTLIKTNLIIRRTTSVPVPYRVDVTLEDLTYGPSPRFRNSFLASNKNKLVYKFLFVNFDSVKITYLKTEVDVDATRYSLVTQLTPSLTPPKGAKTRWDSLLFWGILQVTHTGQVYVSKSQLMEVIWSSGRGFSDKMAPIIMNVSFSAGGLRLEQVNIEVKMVRFWKSRRSDDCSGSCYLYSNKTSCEAGCGLGTLRGRCMWNGAYCSPDNNTCPDGFCTARERLNSLYICPADCMSDEPNSPTRNHSFTIVGAMTPPH